MKTVLLLTEEDIVCKINGKHFEIHTKEGVIINFNAKASIELKTDLICLTEQLNIDK